MTKRYEIEIRVMHVVEVEADSIEEAEELAYDQFMDEENNWDEVDYDFIYEEEI